MEEDYIKNTILLSISDLETPLFRQHNPFSHVHKRLLEKRSEEAALDE